MTRVDQVGSHRWQDLRADSYSPAFMIMAAAAISFAAILKFDETYRLKLQTA